MGKKVGYGKHSLCEEKLTPCICPRCKCEHEKKLFWVGKLPAPKYCKLCEKAKDNLSSSLDKSGILGGGRTPKRIKND